jgi:4'-phosphopantetheinyl transferase
MINLLSKAIKSTQFTTNSIIKIFGRSIHLYWFLLDDYIHNIKYYNDILSIDEIYRADNFHFEKDRNRFIISRGILREILFNYIEIPPNNILFSYSEYGKPFIMEKQNQDNINFNLSHSDKMMLVGITHKFDIGVDIEKMKMIYNMEDIICRYALEADKEKIKRCSEEEKIEAFYRWWTRNESIGKATGFGIKVLCNAPLVTNNSVHTFKTKDYINSICIKTQ